MRIFKYTLDLVAEQVIAMPKGASILTVRVQSGQPVLWALADETQAQSVLRKLAIHGTGEPIGPGKAQRHVGTFQAGEDAATWHVFEASLGGAMAKQADQGPARRSAKGERACAAPRCWTAAHRDAPSGAPAAPPRRPGRPGGAREACRELAAAGRARLRTARRSTARRILRDQAMARRGEAEPATRAGAAGDRLRHPAPA